MKNATGILFITALLATASACTKDNKMSPIPEIAFNRLTPGEIRAGSSEDTAFLEFRYTDGDGDLGNTKNSGLYDIYITDNRFKDSTTRDTLRFYFPSIPDDIVEPSKGIKGVVTVSIPGAFVRPPRKAPGPDTASFSLFITDRARHISNTIQTSSIILH